MLKVTAITASYGNIKVLKGINIDVKEGELVTIVGANGAGKSTLLNSIIGAIGIDEGMIQFLNGNIEKEPSYLRVRKGLVLVPEGRAILIQMSVFENLLIGGYARKNQATLKADAESMFDRFPLLRERKDSLASVLSGGEQQMLTIARALMARPKLLMIDEPSLGLAPLMIQEVFQVISDLRNQGLTILLVEQNAVQALKLADRGYVIEQGNMVAQDSADQLLTNLEELEKAYFGVEEAEDLA
ncbi:MAG: ABC transporter ATP-binding protein [Desulfobacteraceae bacterium]